MNAKKVGKTAAVIDLEPTFAKLKISQLKKGKAADLEVLEYPLPIGSEIFTDGKIGLESFRQLSKVLRGYGKVMQEYEVENCLTAIGHELSEAKNLALLVDRLKTRAGLTAKRYGFGGENALICREIMTSAFPDSSTNEGFAAVVLIGAGTVGISAFEGQRAVFTRAFPAGPLRLGKMFSEIQDISNLAGAAEDYLDDLFGSGVRFRFPSGVKPRLIFAGHEMRPAGDFCGTGVENPKAEPERIAGLFERIRDLSADKIGMRFDLPEETAGKLYFTLAVARSLIKLFAPESSVLSEVDLSDALTRQLLLEKEHGGFQSHVRESAVSCARRLTGSDFKNREPSKHTEFVRKLSCRIFDRLQKEYGFEREERLLIELSAVLNGCERQIREDEIYGITAEENVLIRSILEKSGETCPAEPQNETELAVSRLSSIVRLAESLDRSGKQKLLDIKIQTEKGRLKILAESSESTALEKWAFSECAPRFAEVFGMVPELTIKFGGSVQ